MNGLADDVTGALRTLRWTGSAVVGALVALALGTAAAVAGLGLFRVISLRPLRLAAALALPPIRFPSWIETWSPLLRTPAGIQADGLVDALRVILGLALLVCALGAVQATIALVARAYARRYEIALRAVLGATRGRLFRHLLIEAVLPAVLAAGCGSWLGWAGLRLLRRSWPGAVVAQAGGDLGVILPLAALAGALAVLLFLAPAIRMASRGWLMDAVAPGARSNPSPGAADPYRVLVVMQLAAALMLLTAAGLVYRSSTPGQAESRNAAALRASLVLPLDASGSGDGSRARTFQQVAWRLAADRRIARSAVSSPGAIVGLGPMDRVVVECGRCVVGNMALPVFGVYAQVNAVSPGFFDTLGVGVLRGGEFRAGEAAPGGIIVNRTMVERGFQGRNPVGKRIQVGGWGGRSYRVVGVVEDIPRVGIARAGGPDSGAGAPGFETSAVPAVYLSAIEHPPAMVDLVVRAAGPAAGLSREVPLALAGLGLRMGRADTLEERMAAARAPVRWCGRAAAILALLALGLAVYGVHGLMRFSVSLRRGEIGIRRAVGATRRTIASMILLESAGVAARGTVVGLIASVLLARALRIVFVGLPTIDLTVTGIAVLALGAAVVAGALAPARTAARLDPAVAVAHE